MDPNMKVAIIGAIAIVSGAFIKLLGDLIRKGTSRGVILSLIVLILATIGTGGFVFLLPAPGGESEPPSLADAAEPAAGGNEEAAPPAAAADARNLAPGAMLSASNQVPDQPMEFAVDGDPASVWSAGGHPRQWIDLDLASGHAISEIRLLVDQDPAGETEHQVWLKQPGGEFEVVHIFRGRTEMLQWLVYTATQPIENVQAVRIVTLESPSWVSWREIEIYGE